MRDSLDFAAVDRDATEINAAVIIEKKCDGLSVFGEFRRDDAAIEFFCERLGRAARRRNDVQRILAVRAVFQLEAR